MTIRTYPAAPLDPGPAADHRAAWDAFRERVGEVKIRGVQPFTRVRLCRFPDRAYFVLGGRCRHGNHRPVLCDADGDWKPSTLHSESLVVPV